MDISKCAGTGCPVKEKCYRFTCPASDHQVWAAFHKEPQLLIGGCLFLVEIPEEGK
jgi:hypothetical protein